MIRTFCDSGVLIAAARYAGRDGLLAAQLLADSSRAFVTSPFVHLEVVPKALFYKNTLELAFYHRYFDSAVWYRDLAKIEANARVEAARCGLGAMDALHLAAAHLAGADEFVTTERPAKAIYRCALVKVLYLFR